MGILLYGGGIPPRRRRDAEQEIGVGEAGEGAGVRLAAEHRRAFLVILVSAASDVHSSLHRVRSRKPTQLVAEYMLEEIAAGIADCARREGVQA